MKDEQDQVTTMGLLEDINLHVLFTRQIWNAWLCMCVRGSLVGIGMGFSRCDSVLQPCLSISGQPWCDEVLMFWLNWIVGWIRN